MNWLALENSMVVAGITAFLATLLGFMAALGTAVLPRGARLLFTGSAVVALALPPFLVTNCWLDLLGTNGLLRPWIPLPIFSLSGTVLVLTLMLWPLPFLLTLAAWRNVDTCQLEADLALRRWSLVRWLLWPAARRGALLGMAIVFVLALNNFAVPSILQVKVLPAEVWVGFNTSLNARAALEAGWPMMFVPVLVILLAYGRPVEWPRERGELSGRELRRQLGLWLVLRSVCVLSLLVVASVLAPLAQLAIAPRTWSEFLPATEAGVNALGNSLLYAGTAGALTLAAGLALWRLRWAGVLWLLFLVPGVLLGIGLAEGINRPGLTWFYRSAAVVVLALVLRYIAFGWTAARVAIRAIDRDLIDAARLEGASGLKFFWHAQWPQASPQIGVAAYLVYLLCLWDVESLVIVVPPGGETLALRIFNLLHYGHNTQVNALCVLMLGLALAPLLIWAAWRGVQQLMPRRAVVFPMARAVVFALSAAAVLLSGCSKHGGNGTELRSAIFSRVEIIGERGTAPGQFNKPRSVALDTNDNLFVVDMTGRVQKFSPEGKYLLSWQMPQTDLGKPKGMDRDRDGNIVVVEPHYQRVNHFNSDGKLVRQWGTRGTNAGELTLPRAVAVDTKGNVILSEYTLVDRVQKFSPGGARLLGIWGMPGLGDGHFNRAEGIGTDAADRIYVADSCNHRIQVFSPEGKFLRAYGRSGTGTNEFSYPYDVRVDEQGRQYVCEFGNSRIQVFDSNDRPLEIIGRAGAEPGEFANPWGLAFDSKGNLYVADSQNHRVQKFIRKR